MLLMVKFTLSVFYHNSIFEGKELGRSSSCLYHMGAKGQNNLSELKLPLFCETDMESFDSGICWKRREVSDSFQNVFQEPSAQG